ncbi:hypothetical protein [Synechococcus sp. WH 8016]|uniref:hypothetical protein n=1 Tax=Synechococcus sp. WH 8016 TaxID=166318 RepID=UPI00022D7D8B|nr:hypothetical protein [Synechococcus sp. WH 8016]EHA63791.1 hypothetical protein Syn8016DRAFT_0832 [Synechococcus sp. WH 8016]
MTISTFSAVSSRPEYQVNELGQPLQLPLPSLSYGQSLTQPVKVDERYASEQRFDYSDTYIDLDDETTDGYESCYSSWGMHTAHLAEDDEFFETERTVLEWSATTSNGYVISQFCEEHEGVCVSTTPVSEIDDRDLWIDWLDCIRTWKETMPEAVVNCIDWSKVNPSDYLITADCRLVLID